MGYVASSKVALGQLLPLMVCSSFAGLEPEAGNNTNIANGTSL